MKHVLMLLYIAMPPQPFAMYEAIVADRAACIAEAERIRAIERPKARGRFETWVECFERELP